MKVLFLIGCAALLVLSVKSDDIVDDTLIIAYDLLPEEQEAPIDDEQGNVNFEPLVSDSESPDIIEDELVEEEVVEDTPEQQEMKTGIFLELCDQEQEDNFHPIHISHPTDCQKFYKCFNGRGFLMTCPSREHWSVHLDRCDYPKYAKCKLDGEYHKLKAKTNAVAAAWNEDIELSEPDYMITDSRCEKNDDPYHPNHIPHPTDCNKFYKCFDGVGYKIKCPTGLLFSFQLQRCDFARFSECATQMILPAAFFDEEMFEGPMFGDRFYDERCPNKDDVNDPVHLLIEGFPGKFLKCANGEAFVMDCPANQHFSEALNRCDKRVTSHRPINIPRQPQLPVVRPIEIETPVQIPIVLPVLPVVPIETPQRPVQIPEMLPLIPETPVKIPLPEPALPMPEVVEIPLLPPLEINLPQSPEYIPEVFPETVPQRPIPIPLPEVVVLPLLPPQEIQVPPQQPVQLPQAPEVPLRPVPNFPQFPQSPANKPQFPNWLPQLPMIPLENENVVLRPLPELFKPRAPIGNQLVPFEQDFEGQLDNRCPLNDDPWNPTHLAHPTDCKKFMKCFYGRAFTIDCPIGQEWHERYRRCDYAAFAQCKKF